MDVLRSTTDLTLKLIWIIHKYIKIEEIEVCRVLKNEFEKRG